VVADVAAEAASKVASEISEAGGRAISLVGDLRDDDSLAAMAAATIESFGGIDLLVNNAAAFADDDLDRSGTRRPPGTASTT